MPKNNHNNNDDNDNNNNYYYYYNIHISILQYGRNFRCLPSDME